MASAKIRCLITLGIKFGAWLARPDACPIGAFRGRLGVRSMLFFNDKCAVGAAEPERIAQHRIYLCVDAMRGQS